MDASIVLPHQLHWPHPALDAASGPVWVVEEALFFTELPFLRQKLVYTRAAMAAWAEARRKEGRLVHLVCTTDPLAHIRNLIPHLAALGVRAVHLADPTDDWIERRLAQACGSAGVALVYHSSPLFMLSREEAASYAPLPGVPITMGRFYSAVRSDRRILMDASGSPVGGRWSYDAFNRKPLPARVSVPSPSTLVPLSDAGVRAAEASVLEDFPDAPGRPGNQWASGEEGWFPYTAAGAEAWWKAFLAERFAQFGPYQDSVPPRGGLLFHAGITPMLNLGLLHPEALLGDALAWGAEHSVPLPSVEGFVRQLLGWREAVRMAYLHRGREMRTTNHFGLPKRSIPAAFWNGTTGILPVDTVIQKVLQLGWCHHIERLMVLGSFMLLCEVHPDEVYRWFSAFFLDAYDWVMVPNVYAMSQYADGGGMATKPYISGSGYIRRMGRYPPGRWEGVWDALYWRFLIVHRSALDGARRAAEIPDPAVVLSAARQHAALTLAEDFLRKLWA